MFRRFVFAILLASGFTCKNPANNEHIKSCSKDITHVPTLNAIYQNPLEDSLLFDISPSQWQPDEMRDFATALEDVAKLRQIDLNPEMKVVVQNDVWGLFQRVEGMGYSKPETTRIKQASIAIVKKLALKPNNHLVLDIQVPPRSVNLKNADEMTSMFNILGHEKFYGLRKLFRIFHSETKLTMVSQLLAINTKGEPYFTSIVGDVEVLKKTSEGLLGDSVFHLDRRALACGEPSPLKETTLIKKIPSLGANAFLFDGPPTELKDNPCFECHRVDGGSTVKGDPVTRFKHVMNELKSVDPFLRGDYF